MCLRGDGAASAQSAARDADVKRIEEAILRIDGLRPLVHASAFLQSHKQEQEGAAPKADATLQEAIGVYARPASLAPFPPGFEPTTCKPILFDLVRPLSPPRPKFPSLVVKAEATRFEGTSPQAFKALRCSDS